VDTEDSSLVGLAGHGTAGEFARAFGGLNARVLLLGGWSETSLWGLGTARHALFARS
jgi:hypothetical protein